MVNFSGLCFLPLSKSSLPVFMEKLCLIFQNGLMPNISEWPDQISKKKPHYFFCPSLILIKIKTEVLLSFCIEIKNPRECWFELCIYAFFFENVLEWKGNSVGNKREQGSLQKRA